MYEWKNFCSSYYSSYPEAVQNFLQEKLNELSKAGWTIHQIVHLPCPNSVREASIFTTISAYRLVAEKAKPEKIPSPPEKGGGLLN